ncbi:MAG: glutaminyl-peptide cyclotransferase [Proteobacteria bacterium]|nr:glutaminyl-peptide cyclotransferase [Pseudomonadota bacterium]
MRRFLACIAALTLVVAAPALASPPVSGVEIRHAYPHDPGAFTEGLFYLDGELFESTGMTGQSNVRRVRLSDGVVLQQTQLDPKLFGEGIVNWGDEIVSLTWQDHIGYRWDRRTLTRKKTFHYPGEGWALTQDGKHLIMSDGTPELRVLEPATFKELRRIRVTADGQPVKNLNELEWVKGEILANIWLTPMIARIDPATGHVKGWIDLSALPETRSGNSDAVANGIAYDRAHDRLFVTGKYWPHLYEIHLTPPKGAKP